MKKSGAQILCESLIKEGVEVIFGIPGGALLPLYDTLPDYPQLRHILFRHEQGAAHAADGYARVTGKAGVCLATSGPGATNLVTGIANAYMDSSPVIGITGQVARPFIGKDAFQETDISGITLPITKYNYLVTETKMLAKTVKEAFYIAQTGRPGPVIIDIPKDVQEEEVEFNYPDKINLPGYKVMSRGHTVQIKKAAKLIGQSKKPIIIAGRGVVISEAYDELKEFAEKAQIPVVTTLLGLGSFPENHILNFGWLGMHGMVHANMAVQNADILIAIGMRFDDRATANTSNFARNAKIIHIDIDPTEIGKNVPVDVPIVGDIKNVLRSMIKELEMQEHVDWISLLEQVRYDHPLTEIEGSDELLPQYVIHNICQATKGNARLVTGVGQHQMWTAQYYSYNRPNTLILSGGLGAMGFELPASIGVKVGCPEEAVWCIAGDGSIQMTIQELATIRQENLAIKIAIINNQYLGLVRQWQELFYERSYVGVKLWNPDFVAIAQAYEIPGIKVKHKDEVASAIQQATESTGPFLIDFAVEPEENVYPIIPPGKTLSETLEKPIVELVNKR
jgi:acetolactate synthase I/II/III large subunit